MTTLTHAGPEAGEAESSPMAFVAVGDLDLARDFYLGQLGLELVEVAPRSCVVRGDGLSMRLVLVDRATPEYRAAISWLVSEDLDVVKGLAQAAVELARFPDAACDGAGIWRTSSGDAIAWFRDRSGAILAITGYAAAA